MKFDTMTDLGGGANPVTYYSLPRLAQQLGVDLDRLPFTVKILLENVLRRAERGEVQPAAVERLARWSPKSSTPGEIPFLPARVLLQDFTGVPAVVDLAAMRSAMARMHGDPQLINPVSPADLVIDHSVQVDMFGTTLAFTRNVEREYERNGERYALLRWAQQGFDQFSVVPPGTGICHQVNLEYLAGVVLTRELDGKTVAMPDTLVGTDSHTPMVNGLGVLGWGVGGIEAEAALLGQPMFLLDPVVVGLRFTGHLPEGATATDLVLTVTQLLRKHGVVGKFVEYSGPGLSDLSVADRATMSNMSPEYGATAGLFPVDAATLAYLSMTNRSEVRIDLIERYTRAQGMFRDERSPTPEFSEMLELDLSTVEPSLAGPKRPQDRIPLGEMKRGFRQSFPREETSGGGVAIAEAPARVAVTLDGERTEIGDGAVAIAAITSCTNTSNPSVMLAAGLLAKKAVERGLDVKPYVKTSLAPGSRVVTDYLEEAGLTPYLEALGFHTVGYGCTTCIGNSGPLPGPVSQAIAENDLVAAAVLSGNRNFEARIHPEIRANYLASPPLVVAFALAGRVDVDLASEPLGTDPDGQPVYLWEIWPSSAEIEEARKKAVKPEFFAHQYSQVFNGDAHWEGLPVPEGGLYDWNPISTYVKEPPFFQGLSTEPESLADISKARVLVMLGDSVTTDHISPAGSIPKDSPAAQYLTAHGVERRDFNSYGSRRGNHEVMMRGTFGNVRLHNELTPDKEGDWTAYQPGGEVMRIFDASERYREADVSLIILAGKEYGSGSSRDWAAKGPMLLGVKAAIAESYERIHRSNLVAMGVLPLQFVEGQSRQSLGLNGEETFDINGLQAGLAPGQRLQVKAQRPDGAVVEFEAEARIDSAIEVEYYRNGGVLQMVLRRMLGKVAP
ncbi:MAG: aconitate hydratase AcnA [Chloroflexota bacterium]